MTVRALTGAALLALGAATIAPAADFSDPTWPCIQRKVEQLSPGIMWPHPVEEQSYDAATEAAVKELVGRLVLRRIPLEDLDPVVAAFAAEHGNDPALMGHVFMSAFTIMARQRQAIIKGIEEYSLSQIALSERIDATRVEINTLLDADPLDHDRIDAAEEQLAWDERIYTDRAQSLTYVCETPVILEQRLFAIAQKLARTAGD
ncbi:hypothetical protein [Rhodovulum strictum]|uniref:Uncharacterized protein n=1 Tax=Rhodovulum strictum TaxID=58314 RepID=A0A844BEK4_9RHOB|nr:hypothetical protein [Rhodovulum strictum]MRH19745.1 hypothetical protein [Rhodovulum strictum]